MEYKENAEVILADGRKLGYLDRIVIDPRTKEVTHLIVKKGFIFVHDKVIPVDLIETTGEDRVILKKEAEEGDNFPDFEETHYIEVGHGGKAALEYARPIMWYFPDASKNSPRRNRR